MTVIPFAVDTGYTVMPNGDVVTSDGRSRRLSDEHARIAEANAAKAGRTVRFRRATPEELEDLSDVSPPWNSLP